MLNISVAPQIKSSAENPAGLISSGSSGSNDPVAEDFGKVLEREVSEAADKHEKNDSTIAVKQDRSDNDASQKDNDTSTTAVDAPGDGTNSFIQSLLTDAAAAFKTTPSLQAMGVMVNPDTMIAAPALPQGVSALALNTPVLQEGEKIANPATLIVNQPLQQSMSQSTPAAGNFASLPNNYWQTLGTADSAAYGKFELLPSELSEDIQLDTAVPVLKSHEESMTSQTSSLNNVTSTASQIAASQDVKVDMPVGHAKWGGEFAQKIVWLTSQQHQVAEIRLNPAHLGPVEVMLSITQDQATAQFVSPHSAVRDAIQDALPRLREMLAENGIQLGNVTVGADSFQQENKQQQAQYAAKSTGGNMNDAGQEAVGQIQVTAPPVTHQGLVNTYA